MATAAPQPLPAPSSTPPAYFVDTKKGEVSELKQLLKNISVERDPKRKRDVIKKVIAYMTLGIDVSRLFTEMVMAIETRDLVVKKMVYLYLCNYAHAKPDLAIMCVNTLQRDCSSDDPMVRGLALRSLCSLRLPSMVEYISEPLRRSLTDISAYVRKTGVMGILKLFHLAPDMVKSSNMIDLLYNMIQDPDLHVITNCVIVLNEILAEEGGMAINQPLILHLLGRMGEFSEWGLTHVLSLVSKYNPVDDEELFSIMNLLDPVLRTSNSGVVLATIKTFMHLTKGMSDIQPQVYLRVKAPLLTLMAGGNPEIEYCILKHLEAMVHRCPGIFDDEYRQLYVRYNEPSFVKYEKIGILALITNEESVSDITAELAEYASDIDKEVSRRSIQAIGKIAFRLPSAAPMIIERLIEFLDLDMNSVRSETLLVMKDLLRKYPSRRTDVLPSLQRCLRRVDEPAAKAAVIWMTGEYGEELPEAPYILEPLIDSYQDLDTSIVKLNLLTATMKLFFKRPPEVQSMLGRLLGAATNDFSSQDLHDRGLLYYRLLTTDLNVAQTVIVGTAPRLVSTTFAEERDSADLREKLYNEFNSLSVLYGKLSSQFVSPNYQFKASPAFIDGVGSSISATGGPAGAVDQVSNADDSLLRGGEGEEGGLNTEGSSFAASSSPPYSSSGCIGPSDDLLDMGPISHALPSSTTSNGGSSLVPSTASLVLTPTYTLDPDTFKGLWSTYPDCGTFNIQLLRLPTTPAELEGALASRSIMTLASGDMPEMIKFFLYAAAKGGVDRGSLVGGAEVVYLVQALIQKGGGGASRLEITLKTQAKGESVDAFVEQIGQALFALGLIA